MDPTTPDLLDDRMRLIAQQIVLASDGWKHGDPESGLPSAADLARRLNLRLDAVKKRLRVLRQADLIQPVSVSPKRYRFDTYVWRHLDADDPWRDLLNDADEDADDDAD